MAPEINKKENTSKSLSILIVDDTPANLELLAGMLKDRGYKIRMAVNGELALLAVRNAAPDLILLDIIMPGMDGYAVCARLKEDEKLKDIPVIFLSALNETEDKLKAFRAGGADYISKPFNFEEVNVRVETQLKIRAQKRDLQEHYDKLRELEKMRDSLVHMMAHDLRSPLTAISSFLQLLKEDAKGCLSTAAAGDIEEVLKAVRKMTRMVSDMVDTSKLEDGKMKLDVKDCDLAAVCREVMDSLKPLAGSRLLSLEGVTAPVKVPADRELVARVLQNLLANAIKFAPREGGRVRVYMKNTEEGARVSVENNGRSIPVEYQQKIFEKFGQVETGSDKHGYSTGLGLNFCKLAVEAHGGTIGVTSEKNQPTTFWFELPGVVNGKGI